MIEKTVENLPRDRSREPQWCWETVSNVMETCGEDEKTVRLVLNQLWKAGYRSSDIQRKIYPILREWREIGGPVSFYVRRWFDRRSLKNPPHPEALEPLDRLVSP